MLRIRCRSCNKELESHPTQTKCCGCSNMTTVRDDKITAVDLSKVVMLTTNKEYKDSGLTSQDLQWQEERRKRKVRRLDFEVR
tara:strand:+ start:178 stop:426 length:249 start_codon:yes stop_codon:yes gene_type:complete